MMAPPISPAAMPGPQPPRQASAGEAVEAARVAAARRAINVFFMAVPFLEAALAQSIRANLSDPKFHIALERPMNACVTFGDKS